MKKEFEFIPVISLLLCLVSCGGERKNDEIIITQERLAVALEQSIENQIVPTVLGFKSESEVLQEAAINFCMSPDINRLQSAQQQWRNVSQQWYRLSIYHFGPLNDDIVFPRYTFVDSLRLRGTDYTNSVRDDITQWLLGNEDLTDVFFSSLTFQKVGLLALESLLFETASGEHSRLNTEILSEYEQTPRKCEILRGMSAQLTKQAEYFADGWTLNFQSTGTSFRELMLGDELQDGTSPMSALIIAIQSQLDYLPKRHVVTTAARISDSAWMNIDASVTEVEAFLVGNENNSVSFFELMKAAGFENSVAIVNQNISSVRQAIADKEVALLETELGRLDGNFKREIPDALEVQLAINFTDGD